MKINGMYISESRFANNFKIQNSNNKEWYKSYNNYFENLQNIYYKIWD